MNKIEESIIAKNVYGIPENNFIICEKDRTLYERFASSLLIFVNHFALVVIKNTFITDTNS